MKLQLLALLPRESLSVKLMADFVQKPLRFIVFGSINHLLSQSAPQPDEHTTTTNGKPTTIGEAAGTPQPFKGGSSYQTLAAAAFAAAAL